MYLVSLEVARKNAGYSQSEAANIVGVNISTIQRWEKDCTYLPRPTVLKFANVYGITAERIFLGLKHDIIVMIRSHALPDDGKDKKSSYSCPFPLPRYMAALRKQGRFFYAVTRRPP